MDAIEVVEKEIVPLVGWRGFQLMKPNHLWSGNQLLLPRAENEATCEYEWRHSNGENTPALGCSCGYYAFKTVEQLVDQNYDKQPCIGEVWLYGKVVEHAQGFRAQFMYPKRLWIPSKIPLPYWEPRVGWMADFYGCSIEFGACTPLVEYQREKEEVEKVKREAAARRKLMDKREAQREYHRERNARLKKEREELEQRNRLLEAAARKAGLKI